MVLLLDFVFICLLLEKFEIVFYFSIDCEFESILFLFGFVWLLGLMFLVVFDFIVLFCIF